MELRDKGKSIWPTCFRTVAQNSATKSGTKYPQRRTPKRLAQLADAATIVANKAGQTGVVNAVAEYRKLYAENKALIG